MRSRVSEEYDPDNLLDRNTPQATMEVHYEQVRRREADILAARLPLTGGDVLSVGCGWNPGRHMFPSPAWHMTGVELEPTKPEALVADGTLDAGFAGRAGQLGLEPGSFDVVLYRLVLHHIAYQGPLAPVFAEAAALLRPGGALIAVEPGGLAPRGRGPVGGQPAGGRDRCPRHTRRHPAVAVAAGGRGARRRPGAGGARGDLHVAADAARRPARPVACGRRARRPAAACPLRAHADADRAPAGYCLIGTPAWAQGADSNDLRVE